MTCTGKIMTVPSRRHNLKSLVGSLTQRRREAESARESRKGDGVLSSHVAWLANDAEEGCFATASVFLWRSEDWAYNPAQRNVRSPRMNVDAVRPKSSIRRSLRSICRPARPYVVRDDCSQGLGGGRHVQGFVQGIRRRWREAEGDDRWSKGRARPTFSARRDGSPHLRENALFSVVGGFRFDLRG